MTANTGDAFEENRAGISEEELQAENSTTAEPQDPEIPVEQVEQYDDAESLAEPDEAIFPVPLDGRDGQSGVSGSDNPEALAAEDPLHDPLRYSDETGELLAEMPTPDSPEGEDMR